MPVAQVILTKDGKTCVADEPQVKLMKKAGWKEATAKQAAAVEADEGPKEEAAPKGK